VIAMPDPGSATHFSDIATRVIGNTTQVSSVAVSPDGAQVAFVVTAVDMAENKYTSSVWLAPADGSAPPRPVTSGQHDAQPSWSPDGRHLVFTGKRSASKGETTLHVLPVGAAGEVRTVATMPDGIGKPVVSPDGTMIAFASRTQDERYTVKGAEDGDTSWQPPRKIERFFASLDGEGWVFDRPSHVYVVPFDGTGKPRNLTPGEFQHGSPCWSPDSRSVLVNASRHDTWDLDLATDIYRVSMDGAVTALTERTGAYSSPSESEHGVALIGFDDATTYPQNSRVGILEGTSPRWLTMSLDRTFESSAGGAEPVWVDGCLLAVAEDRGETHLYEVHLDGSAPTKLTSGAISVRAFDASGGVVAYAASAVDQAADLFVLRNGAAHRLTAFADAYRIAARPLPWERFAAPCADGADEIDAWIMRPADFDELKTYPVLLNVHGGPHTQYGEVLFDEAQMQAAAGFVVLMSNPRGGSGREERWGQAIMGPKHHAVPGAGWGSVDVDDVLAVLDTALARYPFCDPQRVGMLGGSYGGYMASLLAAHHGDRFRGICSERAVNNMYTEEYTSDIATMFRAELGPRHVDDPDEYHAISPIRSAHKITTPMLLIHSENDLRCPISQAEELFVALRLKGADVTFYRFPGEGHELSRSGSPVHRRQRAEILLEWFIEKLK
jgi:dipeptidyl aminopeptidase/acylaminoacyl peptidase